MAVWGLRGGATHCRGLGTVPVAARLGVARAPHNIALHVLNAVNGG